MQRYSNKEPLVFLYVVAPYIGFMDLLILGNCMFSSVAVFLRSFGIAVVYFFLIYAAFGTVAVAVKNRYPAAGDLFLRVRIMLPMFYLMNAIAVYGLYQVFKAWHWIGCDARPEMYWWTVLYACVMSTGITFVNEGVANWQKWKDSLAEGEKLSNAYQRSRLLGLKGQINPHFLFNCFNTLSGLIQEDTERAEQFLNEMTKVHRYLLRGDDEYLVRVEDELKFARAYFNLTKARFGKAIQTFVQVPPELLVKRIPPLSMQVILENIIYTNALSRQSPLTIRVTGDEKGRIVIMHSLHEKTIVQNLNLYEGLDNLIMKYRLLNAEELTVTERDGFRVITVPLFDTNALAA